MATKKFSKKSKAAPGKSNGTNTDDAYSFSTDEMNDMIEKLDQARAVCTLIESTYGPGGERPSSEIQRTVEVLRQLVVDVQTVLCEGEMGVTQ